MITTPSSPLKIYTDAAHSGNSVYAIGYVYCNHNGKPIGRQARQYGKCGINKAEEEAMIEALQNAPRQSRHAILRGDSLNSIEKLQSIQEGSVDSEKDREIKSLLDTFDYLSIEWIPREDNYLAHIEAARGAGKLSHI